MSELNSDSGLVCLLFENQKQRFALELRYVDEIVLPRPVVPVPMAPPFVGGIINLRGRVITLLSLMELMNLEGEAEPPEAMVVLKIPGMELCLSAERIVGIEKLQAGILTEGDREKETASTPVKGVLHHRGDPVNLLDMDKLVTFVFEYEYQGQN
jgi:two-component system chemotaxis response regulator CheV